MTLARFVAIPIALALLASCKESTSTEPQEAFNFTVLTTDSLPVADVRVLFLKDGSTFAGRTNAAGTVQIPAHLRGGAAAMSKTDYRPTEIIHGASDTVLLLRSLKRLRQVGPALGTAVRFGNGSLVTFDWRGVYRAYAYNNASVTNVLETRFSDTIIAINRYTAFGDTLWFTTRDTAIYAISLADPTAPRVLHQFRLPAVPGPIAVRDSIIILGEERYPAAARVLTFSAAGLRQISSIQYFYPKQLCLVGQYAVFFEGDPFYAAFDLSNLTTPLLVHLNSNPGFTSAQLHGRRIVLSPPEVRTHLYSPLLYTTWEISTPAAPGVGGFYSDSYITAVGNATTMVGTWHRDPNLMTIVEGAYPTGSYQAVACRSWTTVPAVDGAAPPFFLFNGSVWMLETVTSAF